jgi:hypothetical protein
MTDTTKGRTRSGGPATITTHHSVCGIIGMPFDDTFPVSKFSVSDVRPYAQYERSVSISFTRPRKRRSEFLPVFGDLTYVTIDAGGRTIYDSRDDVPIDMDKWEATRAEHQRQDRDYHDMFRPTSASRIAHRENNVTATTDKTFATEAT